VSAAASLLIDELVERVAARVVELLGAELQAPTDPSPWMNVEETAEYLRCKPKRIYDLVSQVREDDPDQRRLPVHRDGTRLMFHRAELDSYLLGADDRADGASLTRVPDRLRLRDVSDATRTSDPQVAGSEASISRRAGK
jgi:excisionase family DNA binding protein